MRTAAAAIKVNGTTVDCKVSCNLETINGMHTRPSNPGHAG